MKYHKHMLCFRFQTVKMGRLGGKFLIAFFPQFIALSLANQNLVPIFISEMGKLNSAFIGIPSPLGSISAALSVLPTRELISQTADGNRAYIAKSHWYQIRIHISILSLFRRYIISWVFLSAYLDIHNLHAFKPKLSKANKISS